MIYETIDIWENAVYQGTMDDGFRPVMDTYILKGTKKRGAVLVCPGGGYGCTSEREAESIAVQFNVEGFHAFVLYYSVAPRRHPQPLMDVSRAMCIIRENSEEWNIDHDKIAVCGFSAGGHLAASLGVHWDKPFLKGICDLHDGMNRPNALILCYPVITSGEFAHIGSFKNLLGEEPKEELLQKMSLEKHIHAGTPPAFIWHTVNDSVVPVENSLLFAHGLRYNNIPFEIHIYPEGDHGLSLATEETARHISQIQPHAATWMKLCTEWLKLLFE